MPVSMAHGWLIKRKQRSVAAQAKSVWRGEEKWRVAAAKSNMAAAALASAHRRQSIS